MNNEVNVYHCLKILEIYHDKNDNYLISFIFKMKQLKDGQLFKISEKQKNYLITKASQIAILRCYCDISKILYEKQD